MLQECAAAIDDIDRRDDVIERVTSDDRHAHQRMQNWRRISQPRGLDDNPFERWHLTLQSSHRQIAQRIHQIAPHRAAQAARPEQNRILVTLFDQFVIESDLAKLVDDDGRLTHTRVSHQVIQQRCLTAAQETGDHRNRNTPVRHGVDLTSNSIQSTSIAEMPSLYTLYMIHIR